MRNPIPAAALLLLILPAIACSQVQSKPLQQLKTELAESGRTLSNATYIELATLEASDGGMLANLWNAEFVTKVGDSTFILDMRLLTTVILVSTSLLLFLFTSLGFSLFRGRIHAMLGGLLEWSGIAPEVGKELRVLPLYRLRHGIPARTAFREYMRIDFVPKNRHRITALAFLGTAFLIMTIGLRGIKFMVPQQPDLIIVAIIVEITVLCMLGLSTWYEQQDADAVPVKEGVRLPDGSYVSRDYILKALTMVMNDLKGSTAGQGGRS